MTASSFFAEEAATEEGGGEEEECGIAPGLFHVFILSSVREVSPAEVNTDVGCIVVGCIVVGCMVQVDELSIEFESEGAFCSVPLGVLIFFTKECPGEFSLRIRSENDEDASPQKSVSLVLHFFAVFLAAYRLPFR